MRYAPISYDILPFFTVDNLWYGRNHQIVIFSFFLPLRTGTCYEFETENFTPSSVHYSSKVAQRICFIIKVYTSISTNSLRRICLQRNTISPPHPRTFLRVIFNYVIHRSLRSISSVCINITMEAKCADKTRI